MPGGAEKRTEWRLCAALLLLLAACYTALQNGQYCTGSGDDAYYLCVARSLYRGQGPTFGGIPAVMEPPGWPLVLAAAMHVSASFAFLNLVGVAFLLAAAGLWYRALLRLASAWRAFWTVLLAGALFAWHRYAQTLHTESIFYFLCAAATLLGLQIAERRRLWWRLPLLLLACAALVLVRWAGLAVAPLVCAAALEGQTPRPRWNRQWAAAALAGMAIVGAFLGARHALRAYSVRQLAVAETEEARALVRQAVASHEGLVRNAFGQDAGDYLRRASLGGKWMSLLLWPPATVLGAMAGVEVALNLLGWAVLGLCAICAVRGARRRQWVWLGALGYCGALVVAHTRPVGRYMGPVAPLLILGVWEGLELLAGWRAGAAWKRGIAVAAALFLVSVAACAGAMWAAGVALAQAKNSHRLAAGGEYAEVLSIAYYLSARGVQDGQAAVCVKHPVRQVTRLNNWALRVLSLATDRQIAWAPRSVRSGPPSSELLEWARERGVRFIVMRPHRLPPRAWAQVCRELLGLPGGRAGDALRFYRLYEVAGGQAHEVSPPPAPDGLRRVSGL